MASPTRSAFTATDDPMGVKITCITTDVLGRSTMAERIIARRHFAEPDYVARVETILREKTADRLALMYPPQAPPALDTGSTGREDEPMTNDPIPSYDKHPRLPQYQCHKIVGAAKIIGLPTGGPGSSEAGVMILDLQEPMAPPGVNIAVSQPTAWFAKHTPQAGGYLVEYADGYLSYSPAEVFEAGYRPVDASDDITEPLPDEPIAADQDPDWRAKHATEQVMYRRRDAMDMAIRSRGDAVSSSSTEGLLNIARVVSAWIENGDPDPDFVEPPAGTPLTEAEMGRELWIAVTGFIAANNITESALEKAGATLAMGSASSHQFISLMPLLTRLANIVGYAKSE